MTTFALRGNTEKQILGAHSAKPIECRGLFYMSGPQPVSALPAWLVKLFEDYPEIGQISISTVERGVVYTRIANANSSAKCERCDGDGKAHGSDRPFEYSGPDSYPGKCPVCKGSGTV